jgi:hypothetical protein
MPDAVRSFCGYSNAAGAGDPTRCDDAERIVFLENAPKKLIDGGPASADARHDPLKPRAHQTVVFQGRLCRDRP